MCTNLDHDWEDDFLKDIGQLAQNGENTDPESDYVEDVEIVEDAPLKLNTYKEVIVALENVQKFWKCVAMEQSHRGLLPQ